MTRSDDDIRIRSAEPEDAETISALFGSRGVVEGTSQLPDVPIASRLEMLRRIDASGCRLVAVHGEELVGCASLHAPSPGLRRAHCRQLAIAVAQPWQARGVGKRLLLQLLDWADQWAGVLRIELVTQADNERAIALYRSLGFVEEGRHRAYILRDGEYVDALAMARLHPRPPHLPRTPSS